MATIIPVGFEQAVLRWSVAGDPEEQVVVLGLNSTPTGDPEATAEAVYLAAIGADSICEQAAMNSPWTFVGVTAYSHVTEGLLVTHIKNAPITAVAGPTTSLPTNCAALVRKQSAIAGRRHKGRSYYPSAYLSEENVDTNGTIVGGVYSFLQARFETFYENLVTADQLPMILHSDGGAPTPVTGFLLDTRIATQRRRMRG